MFADDETPELADRLRANVSRVAAYKAAFTEAEFAKIAANQEYDEATRKAAMKAAEERFARWTDAEYNTATARCRTAKQFSEFLEPDNRRLFPNLQWLATRSATPRADHAAFAGKIWPKTDPFWNSHAPGTEWNCKCDIAETDEPATDNSDVPNIEPPRGLEGNPAETGEVFTDNVGYIRNADFTVKKEISKFSSKPALAAFKAKYQNKIVDCELAHENVKLYQNKITSKHIVNSLFNNGNAYWLKNEYLKSDVEAITKNATLIGKKEADTMHNTNQETIELKQATDFFFYYKFKFGDSEYYLHVGRYRKTKQMYLYDITDYNPI